MVKNPSEIQMWVLCLGWEDPLEEEMPTHSTILSWKIPWMEGALEAIVHGVAKRVRHDLVTKQQQNLLHIYMHIYVCVSHRQ